MSDYISKELFQRTPAGKTRTWQVKTEGDKLVTLTGDYGSDKKVSAPTHYQAKNVGRANERSAEQAAVDAAKSKYKAKLDEGYAETLEQLAVNDAIPRAMLARPKIEKEMKRINAAIEKQACYIQPKLDGFRCLADRRGLWTRNLRKIDTCRHIEEALKPLFLAYPDVVLDGELYSHEHASDFSKLQSLLTKDQTDMLEQLEVERVVGYHIYDFVSDKSFVRRFLEGRNLVTGLQGSNSGYCLEMVQTMRAKSVEHIYKKHAAFVEQGYEGTMIRISGSDYEQGKRAMQLVKLKDFHDEEFTIVDVKEGNGQWAGCAKSITCRMKNSDETFDAGCRGSMPQLKVVLDRAEDYIGGKATVQFFDKFPSGKPRFPIATKYFTR